jgi:uncharacterized protein YecA (UPF0149 family)
MSGKNMLLKTFYLMSDLGFFNTLNQLPYYHDWGNFRSGKKTYGSHYVRYLRKEEIHQKSPDRNKPCPCGSGKKYKKCCFLKDTRS